MQVRGAKSGFRRTIPLRRGLRRNQTFAEQRFWARVSNQQFFHLKFRRQHGIGPYIVDFYCPARKLVVEIDGDTHVDDRAILRDRERTRDLTAIGYTVIRYTNLQIIESCDEVFEDLARKLGLL